MIHPIAFTVAGRDVSFKFDFDLKHPSDAAIAWYLQHGTPPEPEVVNLMARVCREGDFVVDAGANVGFFTVLLSQLVGPTGRVLAIEPGHNNLHKLQRNIAINNGNSSNIVVCDSALAAKAGTATFHLNREPGQNARFYSEGETTVTMDVPATTLDALCEDVPKLIKMDIEGSECDAMRGAAVLLSEKHPPHIISEINIRALNAMDGSAHALYVHMKQHRYDMFELLEDGSKPFYVSAQSMQDWKPKRENTNVLFSTQEDVDRAWSTP